MVLLNKTTKYCKILLILSLRFDRPDAVKQSKALEMCYPVLQVFLKFNVDDLLVLARVTYSSCMLGKVISKDSSVCHAHGAYTGCSPTQTILNGLRHEDFAVLGQFWAKIIT